ncbi:hypothetical protein Ddye_006619 [Dipteronia dyeriana]|uniref:Uncharacterized protein n=1 Tax=Dipteronia dyeriana TaxID=168575 RepID=A0AAE0CQW6_9ROSI|nr:hypothetical protein Ddye_006619 [Dipteronia dyeriana]
MGPVGWFLSAYFLGGYEKDGRGMNGLSKAVIAATKSWALGIPMNIVADVVITKVVITMAISRVLLPWSYSSDINFLRFCSHSLYLSAAILTEMSGICLWQPLAPLFYSS